MSVQNFQLPVIIPAFAIPEAQRKQRALESLARLLDTETLEAVANKLPGILKSPVMSKIIRRKLGLK